VSAFNGEVLISIVMGNQIDIYHVNAASSAGLKLIAIGTSSALGPDGLVYFVHSGVLVRLGADGAATVGPQMADHPNRLGGAFSTSMPSPEAWFGSSSLRAKVRMPP